MKKRITALARRIASALPAVVLAGQVSADPLVFDCVAVATENRCTALDAGLTVEVLDGGDGRAAFVVVNDGPADLTIDRVYVQDAGGRLVGPPQILNNGSEMNFKSTGTREQFAAAIGIRPTLKVDPDLSVSAPEPSTVFGINPGESLGLTYAIAGGHTLSDVIQDLETGKLRFGVRTVHSSGGALGGLNTQALEGAAPL